MSLLYISDRITIYGGLILLVGGVIGNSMNIYIFSSVRTYRTTPSSFYFLTGSIINLLYILLNLTSRILNAVFGFDLTTDSVIWCKIRNLSICVLSLITFTCSCLGTIDQFVVTSRNVRLRRCSNIRWSHRIIFVVIIVSSLHGIPVLLYANLIPPKRICSYTNLIYESYISIYILVILYAIPVLIMVTFGWLTYRNIHQVTILADQHADRQSVRMTLIQIFLVIISMVPYGIYVSYILIREKPLQIADRAAKEYLISAILSLTSYLYYVGNFYMFLISSSRFRRTVQMKLCCCFQSERIRPLPV